MIFTIPCELYTRLAGVAIQPDEETNRPTLRSVRIEHLNGRCVAIASNAMILAGEFITDHDEPDGGVNVTIDPALVALAAQAPDANLIVNQAPGWTVITTSDGMMFPGNGEVPGEYPEWRGLIPTELPTKNNGCFSFSGRQMARLCASSPSGRIRCARNIDMAQPTIVRDVHDENWFGIFMCSEADGKQEYKPATVPEFLK